LYSLRGSNLISSSLSAKRSLIVLYLCPLTIDSIITIICLKNEKFSQNLTYLCALGHSEMHGQNINHLETKTGLNSLNFGLKTHLAFTFLHKTFVSNIFGDLGPNKFPKSAKIRRNTSSCGNNKPRPLS
jgi:hypothetical protein